MIKFNVETLRALLARVEAANGSDRELDLAIAGALVPDVICLRYNEVKDKNEAFTHWEYTASIDAAVALIERVLPGWWWKFGTCHLSDDACIAPDYSSPINGERLAREFPLPEQRSQQMMDETGSWFGPLDGGFDIDRRPSGNVPLALIEALLTALIHIAGGRAND